MLDKILNILSQLLLGKLPFNMKGIEGTISTNGKLTINMHKEDAETIVINFPEGERPIAQVHKIITLNAEIEYIKVFIADDKAEVQVKSGWCERSIPIKLEDIRELIKKNQEQNNGEKKDA